MPESKDTQPVSVLEMHEEFIQHIEAGSRRIQTLAIITIVVALALASSYAYQLALPGLTGTSTVTVDLTNPFLEATEVAILALTLVWLYVGVRDLFFTREMAKAIRDARAAEREIERRMSA